jgi:hypothetical protein
MDHGLYPNNYFDYEDDDVSKPAARYCLMIALLRQRSRGRRRSWRGGRRLTWTNCSRTPFSPQTVDPSTLTHSILRKVISTWLHDACFFFNVFNQSATGALPPESLSWFRIINSEIEGCDAPVTIVGDSRSVLISQGALGDNHFVSALRGTIQRRRYCKCT